jgi:hypothetical protein
VIDPKTIAERWRRQKLREAKGFDPLYPDAGRNAQPEVQEALERWRQLSREEKLSGPLWHWLLGDPTPVYKLPGEAVGYVSKSPIDSRRCDNCRYAYKAVVDDKYICSVIRGTIEPEGWCELWDGAEPS